MNRKLLIKLLCVLALAVGVWHVERKNKILEQKLDYITNLALFKTDVSKMPAATGDLRDVQKMGLILLQKFDEVCRKHNLRYWLAYRTLLGAIRHNGFIPWDDDTDVCMPIEDYRKFIEIADKELQQDFRVFKIDPLFAKLTFSFCYPETDLDKASFFIRKRGGEKACISLDIFPCHFVSSPNCDILKLRKQVCQTFKKYDKKDKPLYAFEKAAILAEELTKKFSLPEGKDAEWMVLGIEWLFGKGLWECRCDEIFPLKEHLFEGRMFFVPNKSNIVLTRNYGDYMRLPERIGPAHINNWIKNKDEVIKVKNYLKNYSQTN